MSIALIKNAPLGCYVDAAPVSVIGLVTAIIFQYQNLLTICKLHLEIRIDGLTGIINRRAGIEKAAHNRFGTANESALERRFGYPDRQYRISGLSAGKKPL